MRLNDRSGAMNAGLVFLLVIIVAVATGGGMYWWHKQVLSEHERLFDDKYSRLESDLDDESTVVDKLRGEISELKTSRAKLQNEVLDYKGALNIAAQEKQDVQSRLEMVQDEKEALKAELSEYMGNVDETAPFVSSAHIRQLRTEKELLLDQIEKLQSLKPEALQSENEELRAKIKELEAIVSAKNKTQDESEPKKDAAPVEGETEATEAAEGVEAKTEKNA